MGIRYLALGEESIGSFFADGIAAKQTGGAATYWKTIVFIAAHLKAAPLLLVVTHERNVLRATLRQ